MKPLFLGGFIASPFVGLGLFALSFATTPTTATADPYQSAQYAVEVPTPEPGQSILRYTGLFLIFGVTPFLLHKGLKEAASAYDQSVPTQEQPQFVARYQEPVSTPEIYQDIEPISQRSAPTSQSAGIKPRQINFDFNQFEEDDPYESVRSLVFENSIVFCGFEKGSGKTEKLGWLISEHLKLGHLCVSFSTFATANQGKGLQVFGRQNNVHEIAKGIRWFIDLNKKRIADRGAEDSTYNPNEDIHVHFSADEITNWADSVAVLYPGLMAELWEVFNQYCRQANTSFALATHGRTLLSLGGKELAGRSETVKNGVLFLYPKAQTDPSVPGGKRCAGWAEIERPGSNKLIRIDIPIWMQAPKGHDYTEIINQYCPNLMHLKRGEKQETKIEIDINPDAEILQSLRNRAKEFGLE